MNENHNDSYFDEKKRIRPRVHEKSGYCYKSNNDRVVTTYG